MKAGRPRKAITDIENLMEQDRQTTLNWIRESMGPLSFDIHIMVGVEKWIKKMDKARYLELKKEVDTATKKHLPPDAPDNVIPFRRKA